MEPQCVDCSSQQHTLPARHRERLSIQKSAESTIDLLGEVIPALRPSIFQVAMVQHRCESSCATGFDIFHSDMATHRAGCVKLHFIQS
ncbi:hypothetical protein IF1G_01120 [Cordyceps javanica]|uniref:Uncharacterized protein n=1 Tax=Cordyceps javanica TaxID=43265 RepID=A0A545VHI6_9HYPO|nr:hypothetical protein IF1G_01120 [Cordyceps javanica]